MVSRVAVTSTACWMTLVMVCACGCGDRAVGPHGETRPTGDGGSSSGIAAPDGTFGDDPNSQASAFAVCNDPPYNRVRYVDFRDAKRCIELFSVLARCCQSIDVVKTYVFQFLILGCDVPRPGDASCGNLLEDHARLDRECRYLQTMPTCNGRPRICWGGDYLNSGRGDCSLRWVCKSIPTREYMLSCKAGPSGTQCQCARSSTSETSSFVAGDICELPSVAALLLRANEGCEWTLPTNSN